MKNSSYEKVQWFLRRLSVMRPGEILFRVKNGLKNRLEQSLLLRKACSPVSLSITGNEIAPISWYVDLSDRERIRTFVTQELQWNERHAEQLCCHRFSYFALADEDVGTPIRWNYDYRNAIQTPMGFGPRLDYRDYRKCGDIKYAWEPNRHHHLVELAKAYYLTGKAEFATEVVAQIDSWIQECPYPLGINWASSLECAIRVVNWCFCLQFLVAFDKTFPRKNAAFMKRWITSVHHHLSYIRRHLSQFSSANNHLLGEACGLFIGALSFTFHESPEWLRTSRRILEEEAIKQIWADGVSKEQATAYQGFVFDILILSVLLAERNKIKFAGEIWKRLERMIEFISAFMDDAGEVPHVGDEDDGFVVKLSQEQTKNRFRSMLALGASLFGREDFKRKAQRFDEFSFWLLGLGGYRAFEDARRMSNDRLVFEQGGYYIIKTHESKVIFDCGPLGYLSLAAHGHADALSVLLEYKGKSFLVDPGTYAYHTKPEWRRYFKGTSAHNTLRINGEDQSVFGGNFMWLRKAHAEILRRDERSLCGRHDGYLRLPQRVTHERQITFEEHPDSYLVIDIIDARGEVTLEQFFHLSPECVCRETPSGYYVERDGAVMEIIPDSSFQKREILCGSLSPIGGWFSPGYDRKVPTVTLWFQYMSQGSCSLKTRIILC